MSEKIKVLIADDNEETRINIGKLLDFSPDLASMGSAASAEQAIELAKILQPDIILMDINMPGMDGITATEILANEVPSASIIIVSVQGEQEYLRRAMIAGAKNYLTKPFTSDELIQAIKQVYENEQKKKRNVVRLEVPEKKTAKVITVFSTKGGVGKTTIATNLAVGLAVKTGARVGLIDADLQFGDISLFLNIFPQATIADLLPDIELLDEKLLESYLTDYQKLVKVLAAPF
ncbi:MAG: response regulator, partial [Bacillota bacterium]